MTRIIDLDAASAKVYLEKPECYFCSDFPPYISFDTILRDTAEVIKNKKYECFQGVKPQNMTGVNYEFYSTKDGRFTWRPFELIHPAIYITLVQIICEEANWTLLQRRLQELHAGAVECTSFPVVPEGKDIHNAVQVQNWWLRCEQRSLELSLEYTHLLKTDVSNCYGSLYTHSIPWALHGLEIAKERRNDKSLLGNQIDLHIRNSRCGQTNGISQNSVLMHIIAELVLAYVDDLITKSLSEIENNDFHIIRYRDDYSIFTQSDQRAFEIVKVISSCLRRVGMQLGVSKTSMSVNIVEGAIKSEKLAGIQLQDMDVKVAETIQKQLLRLHVFSRQYPNTGAINRLALNAFKNMLDITKMPNDLDVQVAIVCDIATISPSAFPPLSGILAKLISLAPEQDRSAIWEKVNKKMQRIPYNGYLEVWLQRVTKAKGVGLTFTSSEPICQIVNGQSTRLWNNDWIRCQELVQALDVKKIVVGNPEDLEPVPKLEELVLFREYAEFS